MTTPSKYHREIAPGVLVDVYDVLVAFGVTNPAIAHAIKKLLCPGQRGHKSQAEDLIEAQQSIARAIEIAKAKASEPGIVYTIDGSREWIERVGNAIYHYQHAPTPETFNHAD